MKSNLDIDKNTWVDLAFDNENKDIIAVWQDHRDEGQLSYVQLDRLHAIKLRDILISLELGQSEERDADRLLKTCPLE